MQTSSGVVIKPLGDKTTTVLGTYVGDTRNIIGDQLVLAKNPDFTAPNPGGFNLLNVPDKPNMTSDQFWKEINEPFLKAVVDRGDEIYLATAPNKQTLNRLNVNGVLERSGFGREYDFLVSRGYQYDKDSGKMFKAK